MVLIAVLARWPQFSEFVIYQPSSGEARGTMGDFVSTSQYCCYCDAPSLEVPKAGLDGALGSLS